MNIFVLSKNPQEAAQMQCDKHIVKMTVETAQILSSCVHLCGMHIEGIYRATHVRHPCVLWAKTSAANFDWLLFHGFALANEYTFRYGKTHASRAVLERIAESFVSLGAHVFSPHDLWPFMQCMPEEYKRFDAVNAYRAYYIGEKARFAKWARGRPAPDWWPTDEK